MDVLDKHLPDSMLVGRTTATGRKDQRSTAISGELANPSDRIRIACADAEPDGTNGG
jgi:hypothetical protein